MAIAAVPKAALLYIPMLLAIIHAKWPDLKPPSVMGAQVVQETGPCPGRECWSPHAELKTDREYGFGLGQLTVTKSFNGFNDMKRADPDLKNWTWDNRFDPRYQLIALVKEDQLAYRCTSWGQDEENHLGMMFSAYNGGCGGVIKDRVLCANTKGCNPNLWFGGVENTSYKSKVARPGYGQPFYIINRTYVEGVLCDPKSSFHVPCLRTPYIPLMDKT